MDEIQTSIFKATADDKLPPKEKHVQALVRDAGEHVDEELAKRLQGCRAPKSASVAAKALVVLHRIVLAGHADTLPEAARALAAVCGAPQGRNVQSDFVAECAIYLRALCAWGDSASGLRGSADTAWHGASPRDVLRSLPHLQQLAAKAVDVALGGRSSNAALLALRHGIIEDALWLFRAQAAGVAIVQAQLLNLPMALVAGRDVAVGSVAPSGQASGGALEVLEAAHALTHKALGLQRALVEEANGEAPTPGLLEILSSQVLWHERGREVDPSGSSGRGATARARIEHTSAESMRASRAMSEEGAVWEERDLLLRALLDTLPSSTLAMVTERVLGLTVESAAALDTSQLRAVGAQEAILAARLARRQAPTATSQTSSAAKQAWHRAGAAAVFATNGPRPTVPGALLSASAPKSTRFAAVADLETLQQAAGPSFTMPPLALSRMPSLSRNSSSGFGTPASPSRAPGGGSPLITPRGEHMVLPPLPVPLAEMRPALPVEIAAVQLSLAAFELLLLASERLGAGVRVAEVLPNSAAATTGVLTPGAILYTCGETLLLGPRQATAALRAAASLRTESGVRLRLLDGREVRVGGDASQPPSRSTTSSKQPPPPFGIVLEALPRPNEAVPSAGGAARSEPPRRADDILDAIRTRLGIPLRQQRWLLPVLRNPLASDPPPHDPPAPNSPAYRALLMLHAGGGSTGGMPAACATAPASAGSGSGKAPSPRAGETIAFVGRQVALLRNAVAAAPGADGGSGATHLASEDSGPAALGRLEAQARRLLSLRFTPDTGTAQAAASNDAAREERSEGAALSATLRELGVEVRTATADVSDAMFTPAAPRERLAALLPRWPAAMGFRLYLCLLEALFENDEPAVLADDHSEVEAYLRAAWAPCSIDASRHALALLATAFDHYQHSGAPQLLPLVSDLLARLLAATATHCRSGGGAATATVVHGGSAADCVMGGASWTATRVSEVLAGMAGYLSGKLRDYRGNFGCDPDELRACVRLWCACVDALGAADGAATAPRAASDAARRLLDTQSRSLIDASMGRHVRRLRMALQSDDGEAGGGGGAVGGLGGPVAVRDEDVLCRLVEAIAAEAEVESQFACAFDATVSPSGHETEQAPGLEPPPSPALLHALGCLEAAVKADVDGALRSSRTISGSGMTVLQALLELRATLARLGMAAPLPQLGTMSEQMAEGWCTEMPELLQSTLHRSLERDSGEAVSASALRTSSAVDVFSQLDALAQVYATFCQLPPTPLPGRIHQRFLELIETQVCTYVMRTASLPPLPPSVLKVERRFSVADREAAARFGPVDAAPPPPVEAADGAPAPRRADPRVDAISVRQLCLRLNNCEWAGEQLLQLAARARADVPGLGRLPGGGVRQCEQSCRDLLDYITSRVVYYELEPHLVSGLYLPSPEAGRIARVLPVLAPLLQEMRATVAPRWAQRLLESVLSTLAMAVAAVTELPNRAIAPRHKALLDADVDAIGSFFLREANGLLDGDVVRSTVGFLYALGE